MTIAQQGRAILQRMSACTWDVVPGLHVHKVVDSRQSHHTSSLPPCIDNFHRLHSKGPSAMLAKHGTHCLQDNLRLGEVGGCALNENIGGLECNLCEGCIAWAVLDKILVKCLTGALWGI